MVGCVGIVRFRSGIRQGKMVVDGGVVVGETVVLGFVIIPVGYNRGCVRASRG